MVSREGILIDSSKVIVVSQCKQSTSVIEVRSFLGLVGYYQRFVEECPKIAFLLTTLGRI